ncbi:MAG: OmpH family outer membrane protein [Gammaproteobacteria bacterium]|nr:MAG: OmpH family outer membrane protein [Gammaproteobacteria bacterium]
MQSSLKFSLSLLAGALLLAGCNQMPASGGGSAGVAILDLAAVAKATGQDEIIRQEAEAARAELGAQLQTLAANLERQISAEREKIGITPSDADSQRLQEMTLQARQQINNAQMQAQNRASQIESELVADFRVEISPLAEKIALEMGASAVLASDSYLFWFDPAADITDEVIAAWRALPAEDPVEETVEEVAEELAEVQADLEAVEDELAGAEGEIDELQEAVAEELQEVVEEETAGEVPVIPAE